MALYKAGELFYTKRPLNTITMSSFDDEVQLKSTSPEKKYCILRVYKKEKMILFIEVEEIKEGFYLLDKSNMYLISTNNEDIIIKDNIPNSEVKEVLKYLKII